MRGWWNEALPDYPGPWDEAHKRAGQVKAAVVVVSEKGGEDEEERVNTLYSIPDSLPKNLSSFVPDSLENSPN